ncbi:MAG: GNAT family N-acetyltransferase, partial [Candidatus Thorarchaeota archaeon]|nr:GNAT family N-acetyltransferase [Candidatus Thorarchaeota archaeon]
MIEVLLQNWTSTIIVTRGISYEAENLPGLVVEIDGKRFGLLTYNIVNEDLEIVTMNAIEKNKGIGTALLDEIENLAKQKNCKRLWLITT